MYTIPSHGRFMALGLRHYSSVESRNKLQALQAVWPTISPSCVLKTALLWVQFSVKNTCSLVQSNPILGYGFAARFTSLNQLTVTSGNWAPQNLFITCPLLTHFQAHMLAHHPSSTIQLIRQSNVVTQTSAFTDEIFPAINYKPSI